MESEYTSEQAIHLWGKIILKEEWPAMFVPCKFGCGAAIQPFHFCLACVSLSIKLAMASSIRPSDSIVYPFETSQNVSFIGTRMQRGERVRKASSQLLKLYLKT